MVFIFPNNKQSMTPEHTEKIVRKKDFWAHRLAQDVVHEAFQRHQDIVHASETAFLKEKERGYREGMEKAELEKSKMMFDVINKTVAYSIAAEQQFSLLIYSTVKQIIGELKDKEKICSVARSAITAMRSQKHITLKINPENVSIIESELRNLQQSFPSVSHIEIFSQSDIPLDTCIASTEIGSAEANLHAQLEALRDSLSRVFGTPKETEVDRISI